MIRRPPRSTLFPSPPLFRSAGGKGNIAISFPATNEKDQSDLTRPWDYHVVMSVNALTNNPTFVSNISNPPDRKSTRLNSSHANISYAVFCLKKKKSPARLTH